MHDVEREGSAKRSRRDLPSRMLAPIVAFARAGEGTTAVEFGLIGLPLLLSIIFLMSIGYMAFMIQGLDFAAQRVARQIRIGAVQTAGLSQGQFISQVVCPLLPVTFNCADVIVNLQNVPYTAGSANSTSYSQFENGNQTGLVIPALSNGSTQYCPGQGGTSGTGSTQSPSYVYLQILYPISLGLSLFSPAIATTYNGQQVYLIMATATFLNEPFHAPNPAC